jgi:hypothetical protein
VQVGNVEVGRHELLAQCGATTLRTTIDVVIANRIEQGASLSLVIILFLMIALGYLIVHFGNGRQA